MTSHTSSSDEAHTKNKCQAEKGLNIPNRLLQIGITNKISMKCIYLLGFVIVEQDFCYLRCHSYFFPTRKMNN